MRITRSARQALVAALEMAAAGPEPVTAATVARRHGIPEAALAKVVQRLVREGLAVGSRGVGGGYRLARDASAITVAEVLAAFEPPPARGDPVEARMDLLFAEVDETARCTLASVSLETLARSRHAPGTPPLDARQGTTASGNGVS